MKSFICLLALTIFTFQLYSQNVIAFQSFEPGMGSMNFDTIPATYNSEGDSAVSGSEDVWASVVSIANIDTASDGNWFWGLQDITNEFPGGDSTHILAFDPVDISGDSNVTVLFDYNVFEFDNGDDLFYEVFFNGFSLGDSTIFDGGGDASTSDWETFEIQVPDSVNTIRLLLKAEQNGGGDYAGYDNVRIVSFNSNDCFISDVVQSNIGPCNDNGTLDDPSDDFYSCDIELSFDNPPGTGTLDVTGSDVVGGNTSASAPFSSPITIDSLFLKADGENSMITVTFSDSTTCTSTVDLGFAVDDCSPDSEENQSNFIMDASNLYMNGPDNGVILKSPNGTCYKLTVDDSGDLITTEVDCPSGQ